MSVYITQVIGLVVNGLHHNEMAQGISWKRVNIIYRCSPFLILVTMPHVTFILLDFVLCLIY